MCFQNQSFANALMFILRELKDIEPFTGKWQNQFPKLGQVHILKVFSLNRKCSFWSMEFYL